MHGSIIREIDLRKPTRRFLRLRAPARCTYLVGGTMEIGYEEDAPAPGPEPASLKSNCLCPEAGDNSAIMVETV